VRLPEQPGRHLVSQDACGLPLAGLERGVDVGELGLEPRLAPRELAHPRLFLGSRTRSIMLGSVLVRRVDRAHCSTAANHPILESALRDYHVPVLLKPFEGAELAEAVRALLERATRRSAHAAE
jgi:hypothetical protein